jgi:hypothetical protein
LYNLHALCWLARLYCCSVSAIDSTPDHPCGEWVGGVGYGGG